VTADHVAWVQAEIRSSTRVIALYLTGLRRFDNSDFQFLAKSACGIVDLVKPGVVIEIQRSVDICCVY